MLKIGTAAGLALKLNSTSLSKPFIAVTGRRPFQKLRQPTSYLPEGELDYKKSEGRISLR